MDEVQESTEHKIGEITDFCAELRKNVELVQSRAKDLQLQRPGLASRSKQEPASSEPVIQPSGSVPLGDQTMDVSPRTQRNIETIDREFDRTGTEMNPDRCGVTFDVAGTAPGSYSVAEEPVRSMQNPNTRIKGFAPSAASTSTVSTQIGQRTQQWFAAHAGPSDRPLGSRPLNTFDRSRVEFADDVSGVSDSTQPYRMGDPPGARNTDPVDDRRRANHRMMSDGNENFLEQEGVHPSGSHPSDADQMYAQTRNVAFIRPNSNHRAGQPRLPDGQQQLPFTSDGQRIVLQMRDHQLRGVPNYDGSGEFSSFCTSLNGHWLFNDFSIQWNSCGCSRKS